MPGHRWQDCRLGRSLKKTCSVCDLTVTDFNRAEAIEGHQYRYYGASFFKRKLPLFFAPTGNASIRRVVLMSRCKLAARQYQQKSNSQQHSMHHPTLVRKERRRPSSDRGAASLIPIARRIARRSASAALRQHSPGRVTSRLQPILRFQSSCLAKAGFRPCEIRRSPRPF